ncbi:MAG TPA: hypothetical protein VFI65_23245 [Streptosporangiaceae bacterium]|nr:hypothetical protein [Streptosporangiaceae bacterium]
MESFPFERRKLTTIKKNRPEYPIYRGEFPFGGELAVEIRG